MDKCHLMIVSCIVEWGQKTSAQSGNLCNLVIVLRILRIPGLRNTCA